MENEGLKNIIATTNHALEEKQPPIRAVLSLKNRKRTREIEKVDECFILDFDPYDESLNISSFSKHLKQEDDTDSNNNIAVVAEYGKVACRDYPHSRHQCVKHPFSKTPHENYCKWCYCYVCDIAAPCNEWSDHCHATHKRGNEWVNLRRQMRGQDHESDSEPDYAPQLYDEYSDE